jgi:hypothetical protein
MRRKRQERLGKSLCHLRELINPYDPSLSGPDFARDERGRKEKSRKEAISKIIDHPLEGERRKEDESTEEQKVPEK